MTYLRRIVSLAVLVLFGILIFQNQGALVQRVELKFFQFRQEMILGFWILFTFTAGALFAMAFDFWRHLGLRWEIMRKDQELQKLRQQSAKAPAAAFSASTPTPPPLQNPPSPPLPPSTPLPPTFPGRLTEPPASGPPSA